MPTLPLQCTLTGEVLNPAGTGVAEAGTKVVVKRVSLDGYALHAKEFTFYVQTDGTLRTAPSGGDPAKLPQGATAVLFGGVRGFSDRPTSVVIPALSEYEFRLLIPAVGASSTAVSQAAFNAHIAQKASAGTLGHVRIGTGINIDADGIISVNPLTDEAVQDALASFFPDAAPFDWTYDDAGNRVQLDISVATGALKGLMSAADKSKLDGVAAGATANSPDATLLARANHTGTQLAATISDFGAAADARIAAAVGVSVQAFDADLGTIAGLSPSNDDVLQRKAGAWTNRTPAQLKTDLALVKADVGLGNVDNTSDANKPVSAATQAALDLKQNLDATLTALAGVTVAADKLIYATGADAFSTTDLSAFGRSLLDDADAGVARTTLGLGASDTPNFAGVMLGASGTLVGGANLIEQRNGTNAQTFRWYHSYSDASNYQRGALSTSASAVLLTAESAGTGAANLDITLTPKGTGVVRASSTGFQTSNDTWTPGLLRFQSGASAQIFFNGTGRLQFPANGVATLLNDGATDFSRLQFGGTAATFPSLKRSTTGLQLRLADDSGYGFFDASEFRASGNMVVTARKTGWTLPTSTKTRNVANYAALTTAQLAEVVAALVNDLHSAGGAHGLLGV